MPEFPFTTRTVKVYQKPKAPKPPVQKSTFNANMVRDTIYEAMFPLLTKAEVSVILDTLWDQLEAAMLNQQPIYLPRIGRLKPEYSQRGTGATTETYGGAKLRYAFKMRPALSRKMPVSTVADAGYLRSTRRYLTRKYGTDPAAWPETYAWARP